MIDDVTDNIPPVVTPEPDPEPEQEPTPNAFILYGTVSKLTDLVPDSIYTINDVEYTTSDLGSLVIQDEWFGTEISIVKKSDGTSIDSIAQIKSIADIPDAPEGITGTSAGSIIGVTDVMEYRISESDSSFAYITSEGLGDIDNGSYDVRYMYTSNTPPSKYVTVEVTRVFEDVPEAKVNYTGGTINNLAVSSTYDIDGVISESNTSGAITVSTSWYGKDINITKCGIVNTSLDSQIQTLTIPTRPASPQPIGGEGTITNIDESMSWRINGGTWANVIGTSVTGLSAGNYQVRVTATYTTFASANATISVTDIPMVSEPDQIDDIIE